MASSLDRCSPRLRSAGSFVAAFLAASAVFFGLNLVPVLVLGRGDSLGNNTDSIYHYTKILKLRGEFPPDPSLDLDRRLPTDVRVYRGIDTLARWTGWPLYRVLQVVWAVYSVVFLGGSFLLGWFLTGHQWAAGFVAASGWGFALAYGGHWGWDFAPIVPHDMAASVVPFLVLVWLRWPDSRGLLLVAALAGVFSHVYPATYIHFMGVLLVAQLLHDPKTWRRVVAAALLFGVLVSPLAVQWSQRDVPQEFLTLFRQRFSYLAPETWRARWREGRLLAMQMGLAGVAGLLLRGNPAPAGWGRVRAVGLVALGMAVVGPLSLRWGRTAPLFLTRATMFVYLWLLPLLGRAMAYRRMGVLVCLASLALRPNLVGPARELARGRTLREAIGAYHVQDTPEFRELCTWIGAHTGAQALLLTPPDDRYLFLRAYAARPVAGLVKDLAAVHSPVPALRRHWDFVTRLKGAYDGANLDSVLALAQEAGCGAVVFPPEWRPVLPLDFSNRAGSVLLCGADPESTNCEARLALHGSIPVQN